MKMVDKVILDQIDNYIRENKEDIVKDLLELIRIPSVQSDAENDAPYGKACKRVLEETKKLYERHGFKSQISSDNKYVLASWGKGDKTVGLFAHGDVVPVGNDWLVCEPFEPIIKDGYIFGRGCHDDKSGIVESLYASKIIRDLKLPFESRLLMMTGSNEETGMDDLLSFKNNEIMPDFCLVLDAEYPYYGGEKSTMKLDLISKNQFKTIKRIYGGESYTIVLGEVTAEIEFSEELFEELKENCKENSEVVFEKRDQLIIVTAKGKSGHVAHIENTHNAMVTLSKVLIKCNSIPENEREMIRQIGQFIGDCYGAGFGIENSDEIFGKLTCGNGLIRTKDGKLVLGLDIRCGINTSINKIHEQIVEAAQENWDIDLKRAADGYYVDGNLQLPKAVSSAYAYVTGNKDKQPIISAGGTYSRLLNNSCSIGTVVDLPYEYIDLPNGHGEWHQPDEKLSIEGLLTSLKILVCILLELDLDNG
ncbi:MAG: Sapep family Mn(2+)-dependent dipeptidase [Clostridia bacterium]|nr:Sapep family Mn(2+)-dependent dipeptidase [Clostridia bacterium]